MFFWFGLLMFSVFLCSGLLSLPVLFTQRCDHVPDHWHLCLIVSTPVLHLRRRLCLVPALAMLPSPVDLLADLWCSDPFFTLLMAVNWYFKS